MDPRSIFIAEKPKITMSDQETIRDLATRLTGTEAALLLQKIWTIEWEKKYWYKQYCLASHMLEDSKLRLKAAEQKSRGEG